jgi:hypothetical protein
MTGEYDEWIAHLRERARLAEQTPVRRPPRQDVPVREFTTRDIQQFEQAEDWQNIRQTARDIHNQEVRVKQVEKLMARDINAYYASPWHDWYSKITGSKAEAEQRSK